MEKTLVRLKNREGKQISLPEIQAAFAAAAEVAMKKIFTCLEEKRVLAFALTSLVALTVLAATAVYHVGVSEDDNFYVAEQTTETDFSSSGQDVAFVQGEPEVMETMNQDEGVPNAEEVGNRALVNEENPVPETILSEPDPIPVQAEQVAAMNLTYDGSAKMSWPVESRNILMEYSMDSTVYHATLNQYKVSRGILIQEEPGNPVFAPADCLVTEVGSNEEIGNYVVVKLGENYSATLGNLAGITVAPNQYILQGTVVGTLAEPTKYYVVEGPNLYFEVTNTGNAVDPLAYLE